MTEVVTSSVPVDAGSTAWMLISSALVLLMVPGLALFYGGLVRRKNVLTTMLHSFVAMAVIGVQWILFGYMLAFGTSQGGWIGWDPALFALSGLPHTKNFGDKAIPELVFVMFQGKFAIITPALISGAVAERMKFSAYVWFVLLWATFIYCPLAHWVWATGGWLFDYGVLDFAGGTVVHISSGISALVLVMLLGARRDYRPGHIAMLPHNLVITLLGAGLLWFGWFGFNAGSAVAADHPLPATSRVWRSPPPRRPPRRRAGLAADRVAAPGPPDRARSCFRHPRGSCRDHPGSRSRHAGGGSRLRRDRCRAVLRGHPDEAAPGVRRLARRLRRARRRRRDRRPAHRRVLLLARRRSDARRRCGPAGQAGGGRRHRNHVCRGGPRSRSAFC